MSFIERERTSVRPNNRKERKGEEKQSMKGGMKGGEGRRGRER